MDNCIFLYLHECGFATSWCSSHYRTSKGD
jgi:hypothetical protein